MLITLRILWYWHVRNTLFHFCSCEPLSRWSIFRFICYHLSSYTLDLILVIYNVFPEGVEKTKQNIWLLFLWLFVCLFFCKHDMSRSICLCYCFCWSFFSSLCSTCLVSSLFYIFSFFINKLGTTRCIHQTCYQHVHKRY